MNGEVRDVGREVLFEEKVGGAATNSRSNNNDGFHGAGCRSDVLMDLPLLGVVVDVVLVELNCGVVECSKKWLRVTFADIQTYLEIVRRALELGKKLESATW